MIPLSCFSLTINDAIDKAVSSFPGYKASSFKVESTKALYDASLGPYFPSLDASTDMSHHDNFIQDYYSRVYGITASYILFDGGKRSSERSISYQNLINDSEDRRKTLLDLVYNVRVSFYTAIAQKETIEQRRVQLDDAQKDVEVAKGRHKYGIVKLSDVLQASVRLDQARFNLVRAEGDYMKALSDLNSLIGEPLDNVAPLEGMLDSTIALPKRTVLYEIAYQRPEIKQAEAALKISELSSKRNLSQFFPVVSVSAAYTRTSGGLYQTYVPEDRTLGLRATWNVFELGKFFRQKAASINIDVSRENLDNVKRQIRLDVDKTYEDSLTAIKSLDVARQQLKEAEQNYSQAFGQYKLGTSDILSLVQAESLLANAREQFISSKLNVILTKVQLERLAGVESIETMVQY
jgi:outer membrane protein